MNWLFKEEPAHYSFADLERDRQTVWNGVNNNMARQNLRKVRPGDRVFFYHTGKERAIVGSMLVMAAPVPDPNTEDPKAVAVQVKPIRRLARSVPLDRLRGDPQLVDWDLFRLPRLSILPVSDDQWRRVEELSEET